MKNFITSLVLVLLASGVWAQKLHFGLKAGLNVSNVSTDFALVSDGQKSVNRLNAGVFLDADLGTHFSLQPQLIYNGKGLFFDTPDHSHTIAINSIDLPIYGMYKFGKGLFIGVGPNFGYNISGKNTANFPGKEESTEYKFKGDPYDYYRFDFGASLIAGYEHSSGLLLSVNYLKGLKNVGAIPDYNWKSNVLAFSLGYKLNQ